MKSRVSPLRSSSRQTSKTVTLKLQVAVTPPENVAVQVTVVEPTEKLEPEGGEQTTVVPVLLPIAAGVG